MKPNRKLRIGLPKGNLNKPLPEKEDDKNHYRGHTRELFRLAEYDIQGYEPGEEQMHPIIPEIADRIEFVTAKPKQFPIMMRREDIDMAIIGKDTYEEYLSGFWDSAEKMVIRDLKWDILNDVAFLCEKDLDLRNNLLEQLVRGAIRPECLEDKNKEYIKELGRFTRNKMRVWREADKYTRFLAKYNLMRAWAYQFMDKGMTLEDALPNAIELGYGKTRISWALPEENVLAATGKIDSEYPFITLRELSKMFPREMIDFQIPPYGAGFLESPMDIKNLERIELYPLLSNTEVSKNLSVNCVASGNSLRKNGLKEIGKPILDSTAGIYRLKRNSKYVYDTFERAVVRGEEPETAIRILSEPFIKRLQAASIEYGKLYKDSIHFKGGVQ